MFICGFHGHLSEDVGLSEETACNLCGRRGGSVTDEKRVLCKLEKQKRKCVSETKEKNMI